MAIGIAIDKGLFSLNTLVYPTLKSVVRIENKKNLQKIKKWNIQVLLTHRTGYEKMVCRQKKSEKIK